MLDTVLIISFIGSNGCPFLQWNCSTRVLASSWILSSSDCFPNPKSLMLWRANLRVVFHLGLNAIPKQKRQTLCIMAFWFCCNFSQTLVYPCVLNFSAFCKMAETTSEFLQRMCYLLYCCLVLDLSAGTFSIGSQQ